MIISKKDKKIETVLPFLYLSIILSPLRCYGVIFGGFNFSLFRIAGIFMIVIFLFSCRKIEIKLNTISKCILIILLLSILQISYSPNISYSSCLSQIYGYIWIFFAYQIIISTKAYDGVLKSVILSAIFPLLLGLYQWMVYRASGVVPKLPLGFLVSAEGKLGLTYNIYVRITSCFGDPAYMTTFFVGVFSVALQYIMSETKTTIKIKIYKIICLLVIILIVVETVMAISVSGIVGMLVSLMLFFVFYAKKAKKFGKLFFTVAVLCFGFSIYFMNSGSELIRILRFKINTSNETITNMYGRSDLIMNALNVWLNNPVFGGGFGSLSLNGGFSSAHSSLVTVLCQQGLIVFVFNAILLLIYPIITLKILDVPSRQKAYVLYLGPFLGFISILALSLGYDTLYSLDFCYVLIAIVSSFYNPDIFNYYDENGV